MAKYVLLVLYGLLPCNGSNPDKTMIGWYYLWAFEFFYKFSIDRQTNRQNNIYYPLDVDKKANYKSILYKITIL